MGTLAQRIPARCPAAFAASMLDPPPRPTITSWPPAAIATTSASTASGVANRSKPTRTTGRPAAANEAVTCSEKSPQTVSSATSSGLLPRGARWVPSASSAPFPWT